MAKALCSRCMRSFERSELTIKDGEALCGECLNFVSKSTVEFSSPASAKTVELPGRPADGSSEVHAAGIAPGFVSNVRRWARKRNKAWAAAYVLLAAYMTYALVMHLADTEYNSWLKPLNLGIHELGHMVFSPFGQFIEMAGGTILQCLVPLVSILMFVKQRDYFGMSFCFGWLSTNLFSVATYVGDARAQELILVTPGGREAIHDWHYLLGRLGILHWDGTLALITRIAATVSMVLFLLAALWILYQMTRRPEEESKTPADSLP